MSQLTGIPFPALPPVVTAGTVAVDVVLVLAWARARVRRGRARLGQASADSPAGGAVILIGRRLPHFI